MDRVLASFMIASTTWKIAHFPRSAMTRVACCALAIFAFSNSARAEDLGVYGPQRNIAEPDAIDAIKNKIRRLEKDGTLQKREEEYRDRSIAGIKNPPPLPGIATAREHRVWQFDPTYVFHENVKDETGKILVAAGTRVNPLDYQPLGKRLLFIDGRDIDQVAYAKKISDANPADKVILTGGSFIELSRKFGRRVYFDQRSILTKHFGIAFVPALVTQTVRTLTIEQGIPK